MIGGTIKRLSETNRQLVLNHLDVYSSYFGDMIAWHNELIHYKSSYLALVKSPTYRLGNLILYPLKWIRKTFFGNEKNETKTILS